MTHKAVLLDTSFFLRFLNDRDPLFKNADAYFRYFLDNEIIMMISTISIAEYCVGGDVHELPLRNLQIIPFNLDHSKRTGEFAKIVFQNKGKLKLNERNIIPNDTKLFAQADIEKNFKDKVNNYSLVLHSTSMIDENEAEMADGEKGGLCLWFPRKVTYYEVSAYGATSVHMEFNRTAVTCNNIEYYVCPYNSYNYFAYFHLKHPGDEATANAQGYGITLLFRHYRNQIPTYTFNY